MKTVQRIEAYKFVLKQFEDGKNRYDFVCGNLMLYGEQHFGDDDVRYANSLNWPEFHTQIPNGMSESGLWWTSDDTKSRKTALKAAIYLAESNLQNDYHETVKTAVNELGLTMLPIPMSNCAKILHYIITMNGISCQDRIKAGHRARIADLRHRHGLDSLIAKEHLTAVDEFGETYYYKRHYVKPEHVEAVILAYLRINTDRIVKARKSKVLEAVQDCGV